MPFLFVWLIQLIIFFAIVTSVASFFTKATKGKMQTNRTDPSKMDVPIHKVETVKRNAKKTEKVSNRPVREERYTRTPRVRDTFRQQNKPIIKDVVTLDDPYREKDKKVSTKFNKKRLKQAIVYKEILDPPISMRKD